MESFKMLEDIKLYLLARVNDSDMELDIESGTKQFYQEGIVSDVYRSKGFNDWFVHDYIQINGKRIAEDYEVELEKFADKEAVSSFSSSKISFFEIMKFKSAYVFKDIFTKEDYKVETDAIIDDSSLYFARLYPTNDGYTVLDELTGYNPKYKDTILKGIMDKYSESKKSLGFSDIREFIRKNPILFYLMSNVLEDIIDQQFVEDQFEVFQTVYKFEDRNKVIELLSSSEYFTVTPESMDIFVFNIEDAMTAEIFISNDQLECEYNTDEDRAYGKSVIEKVFGELLIHFKDEIITLDELL